MTNIKTPCFCVRCGYTWHAHVLFPLCCPRCNSRVWNQPRPAWHDLVPGESTIIRWQATPRGDPDYAANARHQLRVKDYAKRHGWTIQLEGRPTGLEVRRLT